MTDQIEISRIGTETVTIPIIGTAPLISHKFGQKAKQIMLDNMQGRKRPAEPKDPDADFADSIYRLDDDVPGFPVLAFKAATIGGARFFKKKVTMTLLRQCLFFNGEFSKAEGVKLARIDGEPVMREDPVRVGNGGADLRYRAEFTEWGTTLEVVYVSSMLTTDSVLSLVEAGGLGCGVGDWRPQRGGEFGTYMVDPTREVEVQ